MHYSNHPFTELTTLPIAGMTFPRKNGIIPGKPHHIILAEKPLCVPDHSFIVPVILHGLHADPGDEEEKEGCQEEADY